MKQNWLKYWGIVLISTIALYSVFQTLPSRFVLKINLPQVLMDTSWIFTGVALLALFLLGIFVRLTKNKINNKKFWEKWKTATSIMATILIFLAILYLSFPVKGRVVPSLIPDFEDNNIPTSTYDERCVFMPGYFRVTHENGSNYFSLDVNNIKNPAYKNKLGHAFYFSENNKAIGEGHESSQLSLLDFKDCHLSLIPPEFKIKSTEDTYFGQNYISVSPDNKYVLFNVDLRFIAPPYDDSWPESVSADVSKYGFWIYNLQTKKSTQIHQIKNIVNTADVRVKWGTNTLNIIGADCSENGCQFNLGK